MCIEYSLQELQLFEDEHEDEYEYEYEKYQIRSLVYALRLPLTFNLPPSTLYLFRVPCALPCLFSIHLYPVG